MDHFREPARSVSMLNMHLTDVLYVYKLREIRQLDLGVRGPYFTAGAIFTSLRQKTRFRSS